MEFGTPHCLFNLIMFGLDVLLCTTVHGGGRASFDRNQPLRSAAHQPMALYNEAQLTWLVVADPSTMLYPSALLRRSSSWIGSDFVRYSMSVHGNKNKLDESRRENRDNSDETTMTWDKDLAKPITNFLSTPSK